MMYQVTESETVTIPTFMMNGTEIVDVLYIKGRQHPESGAWCFQEQTYFVTSGMTHVVVELPTGCFEWEAWLPESGGWWHIGPRGSSGPGEYQYTREAPLVRCVRRGLDS